MPAKEQTAIEFYTRPAVMTSAGRFAALLQDLPSDLAGLAAVAQGLLIHVFWAQRYGVTLSEADQASVHIRPAEEMLEQITARDGRPLHVPREPAARLAVNCRHFTVLMTAMLRAQGTPARARCGFGGYFTPGFFEDHWVCEYWNASQQRWVLVDAQLDDRQRGWLDLEFDVTDVPRDRFLVAGQAWTRYRSGQADPAAFGLSAIGEAGDWWIAGNLMRDAAALLNVELLPWDTWGAMPDPASGIDDDLAALFDQLAALTLEPGDGLAELRRLSEDDVRLRVPPSVHNFLRGTDDAWAAAGTASSNPRV
jgi:Transglutaminase-like superfamily